MNEIANNFLLAGYTLIPKMHLRQPAALCKPAFTYKLVDHLLKTKKEHKNLTKQEIQDTFIKTN